MATCVADALNALARECNLPSSTELTEFITDYFGDDDEIPSGMNIIIYHARMNNMNIELLL